MIRKKVYLSVFSIVVCLAIVISTLFIVNAAKKHTSWLEAISADAYDFPILPDVNKEEWAKLESAVEKNAVLQIPEDKLKSMSTAGLIATCMKYPNLVPLFAFNSPVEGIEKMIKDFNGLSELLSREDAGAALVEFYSSLDLDSLLATDKYPSFRLQLLEYIIAHPSILSKVSDRKELLEAAYQMAELKQRKYSEELDVKPTLLILARILEMDYPEIAEQLKNHEAFSHFLETGNIMVSYEGEWDEILSEMEKGVQSIIDSIE